MKNVLILSIFLLFGSQEIQAEKGGTSFRNPSLIWITSGAKASEIHTISMA